MRFASPEFLWLFLFIPVLILYALFLKEGDIPAFRFSALKKLGNIGSSTSFKNQILILGTLRSLCLIFLILGLSRPQKGLKSEELTTKATDIMICLDVSRSMLAIDFKPDNRFQVAKKVIADFIKGREHDRIGLVLFAEHAVTQCPLTSDKDALLTILDGLQIGVIPPDQTAIGTGVGTAVNRLKNSQAKSKILILLTDGSNNAGSVDPTTAAKTAASFGIKIYSVGTASPGETMIPIDDPLMGKRLVPMKSDLDEETLDKVSSQTNGKYFRANDENALKTIFKEIDSLEKTDIKVKEYVDYQELYVWFLLCSLIFLFLELTLSKTLFWTLP